MPSQDNAGFSTSEYSCRPNANSSGYTCPASSQGTNYDNRSQAGGDANQYTKSNDSYTTMNAECPRVEATVHYSTGGSAPLNGSSKTSSNSYTPYEITYRGTNSQGNNYDNRIQPAGRAYHYSNSDGSYYYRNGDNSSYYNSGNGSSTYTAPNGNVYKK